MEKIGIRDLKENMSRCMQKVKAGESIIVTDRKKEIALISPIADIKSDVEKICRLIQRGAAAWSGGKPQGMPERVVSKGKSVSSAVVEDRR
jgi:antitoxin (DNA-binding transcriptional repressor) of toxin-antitoxin stability system